MDFPAELSECRSYLTLLARANIDPRLKGRIDPSDVVQQTMLEAHARRDAFRGRTKAEWLAWLRQALAHNLHDTLRRHRTARRDVGREKAVSEAIGESSLRLEGLLADQGTSPPDAAERSERAVRLAYALEELPEAQRDALVLQHWHGWTLQQIAEQMNKTPAAVAGLLKRGLSGLRERLRNWE